MLIKVTIIIFSYHRNNTPIRPSRNDVSNYRTLRGLRERERKLERALTTDSKFCGF